MSSVLSPARIVGIDGETAAMRYLHRMGYWLIARNVRVGRDEIDLLMHDPQDDVLVFVEVKARSRRDAYGPELSAHHRKILRVQRGIRRWIAM